MGEADAVSYSNQLRNLFSVLQFIYHIVPGHYGEVLIVHAKFKFMGVAINTMPY